MNRDKYKGIYASWYAMKQRCRNKNHVAYKNYGGRGVKYDAKWETFAGFSDDMGATYQKGLTLDRIDNNGNYEKDNCRWASRNVQANNKRTTVYIR